MFLSFLAGYMGTYVGQFLFLKRLPIRSLAARVVVSSALGFLVFSLPVVLLISHYIKG
jgi:hypothetical protein